MLNVIPSSLSFQTATDVDILERLVSGVVELGSVGILLLGGFAAWWIIQRSTNSTVERYLKMLETQGSELQAMNRTLQDLVSRIDRMFDQWRS